MTFRFQGMALFVCGLLPGATVANGEVKILTRKEWGAQPAKEKENISARVEGPLVPRGQAVYLTVHHNQEPVKTLSLSQQLRDHQKLMFHYTIDDDKKVPKSTRHIILRDTPYHYFIDATGQVAEGRELRFAAYSNTEYLTPIAQHITIVLEGDFEKIEPTNAQVEALVELLAELATKHSIPLKNISYHQDVVKSTKRADGKIDYGTKCPGQKLIDRFSAIKAELAKKGIN
jgi:N-acetyl-anhydromuramyl-L-alanine amidase AmpD